MSFWLIWATPGNIWPISSSSSTPTNTLTNSPTTCRCTWLSDTHFQMVAVTDRIHFRITIICLLPFIITYISITQQFKQKMSCVLSSVPSSSVAAILRWCVNCHFTKRKKFRKKLANNFAKTKAKPVAIYKAVKQSHDHQSCDFCPSYYE